MINVISNCDNSSFNLINSFPKKFAQNFGEKDLFEIAGDFSLSLARKSFGFELISKDNNNPQVEKIYYSVIHIFFFLFTLPLSCIVSLAGLVFISLSKTHQNKFNQLIEKIQPSLSLSSLTSEPLPTLINHPFSSKSQYLDELLRRRKNIYEEKKEEKTAGYFQGSFGNLRNKFSFRTEVGPDFDKLSNLTLDCQNDDEAYFIPVSCWENITRLSRVELDPKVEKELAFLIEALSAAFETGKKIVVVRLANANHAVAAGFCADGHFKIIDSMLNLTFDVTNLIEQLNKAQLKDSKGKVIHFKGEYINTSIQKDGCNCTFFATLYCYQMYKQKNLDAFEEVNGAFAEGKLKRFEDCKKIDGSRRIRSFEENSSKDLYNQFMCSWAYRTQGFLVDTWEEIKPLSPDEEGEIAIYYLSKHSNFPPDVQCTRQFFLIEKEKKLVIDTLINMPKEQEIPLNKDDTITLGSLLSSKHERRLLIFEKKEVRMYRLLLHQELFYSLGEGHMPEDVEVRQEIKVPSVTSLKRVFQ
jgi:hypothetical protein